METEVFKVESLQSDPANARLHSSRNIDAIKASLARFGQQKPIIIDQHDVVRAGNGTLEAAKQLGWTTIEGVKSDLEGVEMTAFAIADNRTSELGEWDFEVLGKCLEAIDDQHPSSANDLGWSDHELHNILAADWEPPTPSPDFENFEAPSEPTPGEESSTSGAMSIAFSDEDIKKIDEVALILSPDEEVSRYNVLMALVRSNLGRTDD